MLCFRKFPVAKKFMDKRGGRVSRFSIFRRIFFVSQCRKFRKGTNPLVFHYFRVSKILGINRKNIWHDSDSNPEPTAREHCCSRTVLLSFIFE